MKRTLFVFALFCMFVFTGCAAIPPPGEAALIPATTGETVVEEKQAEGAQAPPSAQTGEALPLPSNLPTALATSVDINGDGGYLRIGEVPEENIALYCDNLEERSQAYLQYGEHFQAFNQKAWIDPTILPDLEWVDWDEDGNMDLIVKYFRQEGTYFDGKTTSPGTVCEKVVYQWDGAQWTDVHFYSSGGAERSLGAT